MSLSDSKDRREDIGISLAGNRGPQSTKRWLAGGAVVVITLVIVFGFVLKSGTNAHHKHPADASPVQASKKAQKYYCPMHTPPYVSDKPGTCPICGMDLQPVPEQESAPSVVVGDRASFATTPERQQLSGVRLGQVEKKRLSKTIRAVGRLEYNERSLSTISLKFGGWIERLLVNAEGDCVPQGTPLFEIYSPELLEAQRSYLIALEAHERLQKEAAAEALTFSAQSVKSARDRLLLWDITEGQIKDLEASREPRIRMPILSKVEGTVIRRNVASGAYVPPGTSIYEMADLTTLWVKADIYEYEIPDLELGLPVEVALSSRPGPPLTGKIIYSYPYLNERTRTVSVRIEIPNTDGSLKPGMYGTASIQVDLGEQLVVDDQAVIYSGTRHIVFVNTGEGRYEPREVTIGSRVDGTVAILTGLKEGEKIVTSAAFLIDSESRLKASLQNLGGGESHKH